MKKLSLALFIIIIAGSCNPADKIKNYSGWSISVLPSSVRLDPTSNTIIDNRFVILRDDPVQQEDMLEKNLVFDGKKVLLQEKGLSIKNKITNTLFEKILQANLPFLCSLLNLNKEVDLIR